ncbi:hypothetical protein Dimus_035028 [Dionaea muscipula]
MPIEASTISGQIGGETPRRGRGESRARTGEARLAATPSIPGCFGESRAPASKPRRRLFLTSENFWTISQTYMYMMTVKLHCPLCTMNTTLGMQSVLHYFHLITCSLLRL